MYIRFYFTLHILKEEGKNNLFGGLKSLHNLFAGFPPGLRNYTFNLWFLHQWKTSPYDQLQVYLNKDLGHLTELLQLLEMHNWKIIWNTDAQFVSSSLDSQAMEFSSKKLQQ